MKKEQPSGQTILAFHPFAQLLSDAVHFSDLCEGCLKDKQSLHSYARTSILYSAFTVEGVANILLAEISTPNSLRKRFDRFQILEKYELFLLFHFGEKQLPRGDRVVQELCDVIALRDAIAHLRVHDQPTKRVVEGPGDFNLVLTEQRTTQFLKIPLAPFHWTAEHAIRVLKTVDAFFHFFFIEQCGMTSDAITRLVADKAYLEDGRTAIFMAPDNRELLQSGRKKYGLLIDYLNDQIMEPPSDAASNADTEASHER